MNSFILFCTRFSLSLQHETKVINMETSIQLSTYSEDLRREYQRLRRQYADLVAKFDHLYLFEKPYLEALYLQAVGNLIYDVLQLTVEIAELQYRRQLLQAYINRDETPDLSAINLEIDIKMEEYNEMLHEEEERIKSAKAYLEAKALPDEEAEELKRLYRLLVKRLHPDTHPNQSEREKDLFLQVQTAYRLCDLQKLREITLLLDGKDIDYEQIQSSGLDMETLVNQMKERVALMEQKILALESDFPFTYRDKLNDPVWVENEKQRLNKQIDELTEERDRLQRIVEVMEEYEGTKNE